MRQIIGILILFLPCFVQSQNFEGVVHGTKHTNGKEESFHIYMKDSKLAVEGTNAEGEFKIIINKASQEIIICINSPLYERKGYYRFTAHQIDTKDQFKVTGSKAFKDVKNIDGERCSGYSMMTTEGSVILYASKSGNASLAGLSKYMSDPVYELIDHFNVQGSVRQIHVNKGSEKYWVSLKEESSTVEDQQFEIPEGYTEFKISVE